LIVPLVFLDYFAPRASAPVFIFLKE
jgi:hypothetical protein